jgi:HPt (histidine-containing phosphotransfer) domain-containing protein
MEALLTAGKTDEWRAVAHKIKGGAGGIGADLLQELCDHAQHFDGSLNEFEAMQNKIFEEYECVKIFLKENDRL